MVKKFLQTAILMLAAVSLVTLTSCSDSDTDNGGSAPEELAPELDGPFTVELQNITTTSVQVRVVPDPNVYTGGFLFDIFTADSYAYNLEYGYQEYVDWNVQGLMEDSGKSLEEVLDGMLSYNFDEWEFLNLIPNSVYYVVAMGIDEEGKISTDVKSVRFQTKGVNLSANTFTITTKNASHDGVEFTITPSHDDQYFAMVVSKIVADEFKTDQELVEYCLSSVYDISAMLHTGTFISENTHSCQPGRDFYVVAFGYNTGVATTEVVKEPFSTSVDSDPALCTFTFGVDNVTYGSVDATAIPSSKYNVYMWEPVAVRDLEDYKTKYGTTDNSEAMIKAWGDILTTQCGYMDISPAQFIDSFASWGDQQMQFRMKEDTEYVVWGVAVDAYGTPMGNVSFSEPFRTRKDIVSEAVAELNVVGYFDGAELGVEEFKDYPIVVIEATPNDNVTNWYTDIYVGDLSDSSRKTFITNLVYYNSRFPNERIVVVNGEWNSECTVLSVAVDADGYFGEVQLEIIKCMRSNARPMSDFADYLKTAVSATSLSAEFKN